MSEHHADSGVVRDAEHPPAEQRPPFRLSDWPRGWAPDILAFITAAIAAVLVAIRLDQRIASGPSWDTYAFLDNAANMAGRSVGYIEPHRPPFLSFVTSLVLRTGLWDVSVIQIVDGALSLLGVIAFYHLLRRRFERPLAMAASILLVLVPPLWLWLGSGYTDFPSVALSICAILLAVKATEDDPRWYWLALPTILFAILTRFGAFLMIFPMGLWFAVRAKPFRDAKHIGIGVGLTALSYVPAGVYYFRYFSDPFFPFSFANNVAGAGLGGATKGVSLHWFQRIPGWYFLKHAGPLLMAAEPNALALVFLGIAVVGLVAAMVTAIVRQPKLWRRLLPFAALALWLLTEWRGGTLVRVGAMVFLGFAMAVWIVPREKVRAEPVAAAKGWHTFRRLDPAGALALDATMLVWGLLFFDAHGHMQPQIDRYFITMAPSAIYFLVLGWRTVGVPFSMLAGKPGEALSLAGLRARLDSSSRLASIAGVVALTAAVIVAGAVTLKGYSPTQKQARDPIVLGAERSAMWLATHDANIAHRSIYSDVWPLSSWYLGRETLPMPTFESLAAFPHELEKNKVDYFITIRPRRYGGYREVYEAGSEVVLKHDTSFPRALPAVAYFGDGWDAYVEQLCDFDIDLYFSNRRQLGTGTWMLDSMNAQQLSQYDAVAIFGTHWRSKGDAEKTLRQYVSNGGTVIIDASHNMDGFSYPLVDTVFMDVLVRRKAVSSSAEITCTPALAAESRVPTAFSSTTFVDENGGPWYGASYEPATWSLTNGQPREGYHVLASIGGQPAVLEQDLGKGHIYWVSGNLFWHAYLKGNDNEVRLVRGLIRYAVGLPPTPAAEIAVNVKPWFVSRQLRKEAIAAKAKAKGKLRASSAASETVVATGRDASSSANAAALAR